jgi:hypothetical protein
MDKAALARSAAALDPSRAATVIPVEPSLISGFR